MGTRLDFLNYLSYDMSVKIFTCLDDPSDIARVSCVSHSWRDFVIVNGLAKRLCLRMFPQLSRVDHVDELVSMAESPVAVGFSNMESEALKKKEHRAYALLAQGFMPFPEEEKCISEAIIASSTNLYPLESIHNTLEKDDIVEGRVSYWSSKGYPNTAVPETLTYKLVADLCFVTEIRIKPFKAYFELGSPIHSAKSVRFRMGHLKTYNNDLMDESYPNSHGNKFAWTYTSQEFPMAQEDCLQSFKLPEPVLCIGGILQIELQGRVQRRQRDGLFYICVAHVQVVGHPLSPAFEVEILEHRAYAFLGRGFMSFPEEEKCISEAIMASSTDRPWESIDNTLEENDRVGGLASYWSSRGHSNPAVPETLTYKLVADLCVVTEIRIKPFKAYLELGFPIYSAKSVRFRMGHHKTYNNDLMDESHPNSHGNKFAWTYTSQEFPMAQGDWLQSFKLPEPALCIGGILQIELCGKVQRQQSNGLFYIRVAHVQVVGRPLSPAFGVEILEPSENFVLKALSYMQPRTVPQETRQEAERLHGQFIDIHPIMNIMWGDVVDLVGDE